MGRAQGERSPKGRYGYLSRSARTPGCFLLLMRCSWAGGRSRFPPRPAHLAAKAAPGPSLEGSGPLLGPFWVALRAILGPYGAQDQKWAAQDQKWAARDQKWEGQNHTSWQGWARNFILPESIVEVIQGVGLRGWTQETMIKYDHITEAFGKVSCLRFGPSLSCVAFPATRPLTQRILKNRAVTTAACYFSLKL